MRLRASRLLPAGPADLLLQVVVFCGAYWLYRLARGLVVDHPGLALDHARALVGAERWLGLYVEPAINGWAADHRLIGAAASWGYLDCHFAITVATLAWIYLRRHEDFARVRNTFTVAMALALVLYVAYPTVPPRLLPGAGFRDLVQRETGVPDATAVLYNPYAAIPSMHVAFALMLAVPMRRLARRRAARAAWLAYPVLVTAVVVLTGNHFWLDAAAGAAVAAVAYAAARLASLREWHVRAPRRRPLPTGSSSRA